jgi:acetyl-CoA C-acetyltransferase
MGDVPMYDLMLGALHDPFEPIHMGITAENVAASEKITREMQDELALESQKRAARAIAEGRFQGQITPVSNRTRKGPVVFDTDEHVRGDITLSSCPK